MSSQFYFKVFTGQLYSKFFRFIVKVAGNYQELAVRGLQYHGRQLVITGLFKSEYFGTGYDLVAEVFYCKIFRSIGDFGSSRLIRSMVFWFHPQLLVPPSHKIAFQKVYSSQPLPK